MDTAMHKEPLTADWHKLVTDNYQLALKLGIRFRHLVPKMTTDEVGAEALYALTKAARRYDHSHLQDNGQAVQFVTYLGRAVLSLFEGHHQHRNRLIRAKTTYPFSELVASQVEGDRDAELGFMARPDETPARQDECEYCHWLLEKAGLTVNQKVYLEMHYWQGLTFREIAKQMDVPKINVQKGIERARVAMRKCQLV